MVRLSYPNLFVAKAGESGGEPKFSAAFLLDKEINAKDIAAVQAAMKTVADAKWPTGIPKAVKKCLRDGSEKDDVAYENCVFFNASSKTRPPVVDKDPSVALNESDGKPYAGCYVNAVVQFWAQDNAYGKRINSELRSVQFAKDGEPLGRAPVDPTKEFENLENGPAATESDESAPW
jgi:hypothetical protein